MAQAEGSGVGFEIEAGLVLEEPDPQGSLVLGPPCGKTGVVGDHGTGVVRGDDLFGCLTVEGAGLGAVLAEADAVAPSVALESEGIRGGCGGSEGGRDGESGHDGEDGRLDSGAEGHRST